MISAGQTALAEDFRGPTATFPTIETTAGATHSLVTDGTDRVVVWAKGYKTGNNNATITLKYNGVTKDTTVYNNGGDSWYHQTSFALMYTETPSAGTENITVETSAGSLANVVIMVMKF
jgi:hypothetical protein